jgi:MFS family permease
MKFFNNYLGKKEKKKISLIAVISVLTALSASFIDTIWALYIESFVHSAFLVGLITGLITAISFISYFFIVPLVERKDKVNLYLFSLIIFILSYLLFALTSNIWIFILIAIPLAFFVSLRNTSFGLWVKDSSSRRSLSRNEGWIYTVSNFSWVLGPLIAGYLLSSYGFKIVFLIASLILVFAVFMLKLSKVKDKVHKRKIDGNVLKNFFDFFKSKKRVFAYLLSGGVSVWWALIYVFIPVYIVESGFSELLVGYFLFAVAIPLVLCDYFFSSLAYKKGFRKLIRIGYLLVAFFSFICFFFSNIYIILGLLVLASFGMAMLESTTETYFFDILKKKQHLRFYGPFNTADSASSFISKLLAAAVLLILPINFLFILFGILMLGYFVITFFIKDSIECRRR